MVEKMTDLPDTVLGITAKGRVTAADYETVIIPAIERVLERHEKVRFLYHLGAEFEGLDAGALWDDAKLGLSHPMSWDRIAIVTDVEWIRMTMRCIGFAIPGHVRVFSNDALAEAREWIVAYPGLL